MRAREFILTVMGMNPEPEILKALAVEEDKERISDEMTRIFTEMQAGLNTQERRDQYRKLQAQWETIMEWQRETAGLPR